jgi:membrane-bound serine protease (ClpP class)
LEDVKMAFLTNPNLAYVLVVVGITLIFVGDINSKKTVLNIGVLFCVIAIVLGFLYLRINPWAFLVVALSPLLLSIAIRQARPGNPLFLISIFMLVLGSYFLFVDQDNQPLVSTRVVVVSVLSAIVIWILSERLRNVEGVRLGDVPESLVGLIGETITDIGAHSAGSVLVDGELWQARSKEPISAGSTVRVLRQDGFWLTVKKAHKLTKR